MKVLCHMVITPNGYIARADGTSVSTPEDWQAFADGVARCNNFVVGRKTFDLVGERGFREASCDYKVVVSRQADSEIDPSFTVVPSPQAAVDFLQDKVDTLFLVGGSELNTAFARQGLIDEIALIVQPAVIGKGVNLFAPHDFELPLVLLGTEELSGGRVKLHYEVRKK